MLEFVDSDLYFVQEKNYFLNPLLQVGSGSVEKSTGSGGPKNTGSNQIRILIPGITTKFKITERQIWIIPGHDGSDTSSVTSSGDHAQVAGVELNVVLETG